MTTMTHDRKASPVTRGGAGFAFAALSAASFGLSGALAGGLFHGGWSPAAVVSCRVAVAALALLVPAVRALRGRWHLIRPNAGLFLAYGLVAVAGCQLAYFSAVDRMPVAVALLLEYTAPVAIIGWLWARHGQRPGRVTVAGALVAGIGLLLVLDVLSAGSVSGLGVVFALLAMVGAAVYFVLSSHQDNALPPIVLAAGGLVVGAVALGLAGLLGVVPLHASTRPASYDGTSVAWWLPIVGLGVVTAAVAYVTGIAASRRLGPRLASFAALMEVLFALVFAWLLLGQLPREIQLAGGLLVLGGVVLVKLGEPASAT